MYVHVIEIIHIGTLWRINAIEHSYIVILTFRGAKQGGGLGWSQPSLNFGEGGSTAPDFERTCCLIAHIGPFLIA